MILSEIRPTYFGPFAKDAVLGVEKDVTVLTGANDTGKTLLLRCLQCACTGRAADETHVNVLHMDALKGDWKQTAEVGCEMDFDLCATSKPHLPTNINPQIINKVRIHVSLAPEKRAAQITQIHRDKKVTNTTQKITRLPNIIWVNHDENVRHPMPLDSANPLETKLLDVAFGGNFSWASLSAQSKTARNSARVRAERRLNDHLRRLFPEGLGLTVSLDYPDPELKQLGLYFNKGFRCTQHDLQGGGVRRLMTMLAALFSQEQAMQEGHTIILADEPETGLHADAQHCVRRLLEELAKNPRVQVIYATHSPSMINRLRPRSLRLFSTTYGERRTPQVAIDNKPYTDNFFPVRTSLGVSAADSLLYSCVTVVVEGVTEVLCLHTLYEKLAQGNVAGFEEVDDVLSDVAFVAGNGDSVPYMVRLAASHGTAVVVVLDGDKRDGPVHHKLQAEGHVQAIVFLETSDGRKLELEQLVPEEHYLAVLCDALEITEETLRDALYGGNNKGLNASFTAHIGGVLKANHKPYPKVEVMEKASRSVEARDIRHDVLAVLLEAIRKARS